MSLLVTRTYLPSGNSPEALISRQLNARRSYTNKNCTAIEIGDIRASTHVNDSTSARTYPADKMYGKLLASTTLSTPTKGAPRSRLTHKQQAETLITIQCTLLAILMA